MAKVPAIIPITDLRQDAAAAMKHAKSSRQPVVITQRGRAAAVLLSLEAYERSERERQLLHLLARGEQEIDAGSRRLPFHADRRGSVFRPVRLVTVGAVQVAFVGDIEDQRTHRKVLGVNERKRHRAAVLMADQHLDVHEFSDVVSHIFADEIARELAAYYAGR